MALDRPVHRAETADGTMAPAVAPTFALESTVQRDMPPPLDSWHGLAGGEA